MRRLISGSWPRLRGFPRGRRFHHQTLLSGLVVAGLVLLVGLWTPADASSDDPFRLFLAGLQTSGETSLDEEFGPHHAELAQIIAERGNVPVIVRLNIPNYDAGTGDVGIAAAQEAALGDATHAVLGALAGYRVENIKTYQYTPALAVTLSEPEALAALLADDWVLDIEEDRLDPPLLAESVPLIGANHTQFLFAGGAGRAIAILDTGVDRFHAALAGKVISGACYSTNNPAQGASSLCPGGAVSSTASNAGDACASFISGCDHGTHVAGIAAGVAPSARIIAIQVFSRITDAGTNTPCADNNRTSPCTLSYASDQIKALERVRTLHMTGTNVASANMSLGGGAFTAACTNEVRRSIMQTLRGTHNIVVVVAAGNSGFRNAMGAPACIPDAFSVAASDKSDAIASYSNIASFTNVIAPGSGIFAPIHSPNYQAKNGTSMAAPHVAGAFAVLRELAPNLSAAQLEAILSATGPTITDNRPANIGISKRRVNVWEAFCGVSNCDADDFRTLGIGQTLNGNINPVGDRDYYHFFGTAGQRLTLTMDRTSGSLDPYLELYSPQGFRVAFNDNGGAGNNALINNYFLPTSGRYLVTARGTGSGGYTVRASSQAVQLNPAPRITRLSPSAATATPFGSDFWVAIYGENFMPTSQVRWNGLLRTMFYSHPGLVYIRVRGSDIGMFPTPPRLAFVSVINPSPGGGTSNSYPFSINFPFLGESALLAPATETTIETGVQTSFVISWTAPITATTWRSMQGMDLRIRNENNEIAAWVRVVEQPGQDSFYRLLSAAETQLDVENLDEVLEGMPEEDRTLVISDTVSLHLAQSKFSGSGLTAIMTPTLSFGPNAVGTWNVEFRVDRKYDEDEFDEDDEDGLVQDDDVLGIIHIVPAGCPVAVSDVTISGPATSSVGQSGAYTAQIAPLDATLPLTFTWAPPPTTGEGTPNAGYEWTTPGLQPISVFVENCGGFAAAVHEVAVSSSPDPDLSITKEAMPTILPGNLLTYTLTVANTGAMTATNLVITDVVPSGVTHPDGLSAVTWDVPELGPFGATTQVSYTVAISATARGVITNSNYGVTAAGGYMAAGAPVVTQIVQAQETLDNETARAIYTGPSEAEGDIVVRVPAGAVFEPTLVTLEKQAELPFDPPEEQEWLDLAFGLDAFRAGLRTPDLVLSEYITYELRLPAISGAQENGARLYRWTGADWSDEGIECAESSTPGELICVADGAPVGDYALFAASIQEYTLDVTVVGEGGVSKAPDQSLYPADAMVTLTAAPATGWAFAGWSGDATGDDNPLTVTVSADTAITATFVEDEVVDEEEEKEEQDEETENRILVPNLQRGSP